MLDSRRNVSLACALSALAGYVDGIGFLHLGGLFVSFMSGNSTRMGVSLAEGQWLSAAEAFGLIALFVIGAAGGSLIVLGRGTNRQAWLLLAEASLLAAAALCYSFGLSDVAVAAIVDARELHHGPLGKLQPDARRDAGIPIEIFFKGHGPVMPLTCEIGRKRKQRRQRQHLVIDAEPIPNRPPPPRQQRPHRVIVPKRRRPRADVEVRTPNQIDANRPELFPNPRIQRRKADRVRRRPKRTNILARRPQKKLPGPHLEMLRMQIDIRLDHSGALSLRPRLIPPRHPMRMQINPRRRRPLRPNLRDAQRQRAMLRHIPRTRIQPSKPTLQPGGLSARVDASRGYESMQLKR